MTWKKQINRNGQVFDLMGEYPARNAAQMRAKYLEMHYWSRYYRTAFRIVTGKRGKRTVYLLYMRMWRRLYDIERSPVERYQSPVRYGRWRKY